MAFEYGQQRDKEGNIIHEGSWGIKTSAVEAMEIIIENFRVLRDESNTNETGQTNVNTVRLATTENLENLKGILSIDGLRTSPGDLVLVKNQADKKQNGLYIVRSGGWERYPAVSLINIISEGRKNKHCVFYLMSMLPLTENSEIEYGTIFSLGEGVEIGQEGLQLSDTGVKAGSYTKITVNTKGQAVGGENPATITEYGITDVYTKKETDEKFKIASTETTEHIKNQENPHKITAKQIGAELTENVTQKVAAALDEAKKYTNDEIYKVNSAIPEHISDQNNPHGITPEKIGAPTSVEVDGKIQKTLDETKGFIGEAIADQNVVLEKRFVALSQQVKANDDENLQAAKKYTDQEIGKIQNSSGGNFDEILSKAADYTDKKAVEVEETARKYTNKSVEEALGSITGLSGNGIRNWQADTVYIKNNLVIYDESLFQALETHLSENTFGYEKWKMIGASREELLKIMSDNIKDVENKLSEKIDKNEITEVSYANKIPRLNSKGRIPLTMIPDEAVGKGIVLKQERTANIEAGYSTELLIKKGTSFCRQPPEVLILVKAGEEKPIALENSTVKIDANVDIGITGPEEFVDGWLYKTEEINFAVYQNVKEMEVV